MHLALAVALVSAADADIDAAKLLREAGKGATLLEVVTSDENAPDRPSTTSLRVEDEKAIAALLALIKAESVNPKKFLHHMCSGHPVTRLSRGGQVLALFSFDHVSYLRPHDGRWPGDAKVLPTAARAMAAWYAKYGFTLYADEFRRADEEIAAQEAYFRPFPPVLERVLRTSQGQLGDAEAKAIERETPDPLKRFTLLCEGLARLPSVGVLTFEHQTTFALTARLAPVVLERALLGFDERSAAALGASRFLFEQQEKNAFEVLAGVPMEKARVIAAKYAALHFADRTRVRRTDAAFQLVPFFGAEVEQVLRAELARPFEPMPSRQCYGEEPPQLAALVVLSSQHALSEQTAPVFDPALLPCSGDRGVVAVARALRTGKLPDVSELDDTPRATMVLWVRRGLQGRRDRAAIDLAVALIDKSLWVMWELVAWVDGLMTGSSREATYDVMLEVKAWWERSRTTWPQ